MADLVVPTLGESITEAVIGRWMKKVGERVEVDEPVLELESDKATMQLPAPVAGTMGEQIAEQGQAVRVGEVVGRIEPGAGKKAGADKASDKASDKPVTANKHPMPNPLRIDFDSSARRHPSTRPTIGHRVVASATQQGELATQARLVLGRADGLN